MSLVNEFIIGDLLRYMRLNDCDILEELSFGNLWIMIDLVEMGRGCSRDEAEILVMDAIKEKGLEKVVEEIAVAVIGIKPEDGTKTVDRSNMNFSDVLYDFYNELQALDVNLVMSEFKGMTTKELYKYSEGVRDRYILNKNEKLKDNYWLVGMFMSALVGKLKECPQLNTDGTVKQKSLIDKLRGY